jgi:alpha-beta hydrolase superfamily lysophospholipase/SAM-dependent methyltransferase
MNPRDENDRTVAPPQAEQTGWPPTDQSAAALLIWGSMGEHADFVRQALARAGFPQATLSAEQPPDHSADVPADARRLEKHVRQATDAGGRRVEDLVVLAAGLDATTVLTWVHDYAPPVRAIILIAPVLHHRAAGLGGRQRRMLRHTLRRLIGDAAAVRVPTLLFDSTGDLVTGSTPVRALFAGLDTPLKRRRQLPGGRATFARQDDRQWAVAELANFLGDVFGANLTRPSLVMADRYGYLQEEYEWLTTPLPAFSLSGLRYRLKRAGMRALALVSPGIRLGMRTGFDSGQMLDYVYENRARGAWPLRWIDRIFLSNLAWEACRQRRTLTRALLRDAIDRAAESAGSVRIVDIAAGPGRYVLEAMNDLSHLDVSALLRDNTQSNLDDGRQLAARLGVENVTFELADAFDESSLAAIRPRPNVAVSCGLYQLFRDNQMVLRSLRGLAAAMDPGGYLVYTGVPWDPVGEFAARTLVNRNGGPSVLCRRTQEGLDELVQAAGFEKVLTEVDDFGVSTVSLARRR